MPTRLRLLADTHLPEVARVEIEGLRLGVVHETGQARGREQRMAALHPDLTLHRLPPRA